MKIFEFFIYFLFSFFIVLGVFTFGILFHEYVHYLQFDGEIMELSFHPLATSQASVTPLFDYHPSVFERERLEFTAYLFQYSFYFIFLLLVGLLIYFSDPFRYKMRCGGK